MLLCNNMKHVKHLLSHVFQAQNDLQKAKIVYEALNVQLLDELPRLYDLSLSVVQHCVGQLLVAQRDFYHHTLQEMYQLLGVRGEAIPWCVKNKCSETSI